jgi:thioredoxin 1
MASPEPSEPSWRVICLCAEWCGVCREWRDTFAQAARDHANIQFAWVDVEDEADAMGDVDIETFPTLLIARGDLPLFLGPVQPSATQVSRLLTGLMGVSAPSDQVPPDAGPLLGRLLARVVRN